MTNEEKIKEIMSDEQNILICSKDTTSFTLAFGALQMADWKDQQFKEYLKTKRKDILAVGDEPHALRAEIAVLDEIIDELFK